MVFQNYALFPHMTVRRTSASACACAACRRPRAQCRASQRAFELVQLVGQEHKLPGQLSGGQQQRVAIARAIVIEPPLMLMDEPLSNLDAKLRLETRAEIRRIHRELGRSTIYVTHDQDEALSLADRIVVMKDGVVQQIGDAEEVYAQPANLHVARFMGYRNVLELDVESEQGGRVVANGHGLRLPASPSRRLAGKRMAVAIRPEEIVVGAAGENIIDGQRRQRRIRRPRLADRRRDAARACCCTRARGDASRSTTTVKLHVPAERMLVYPAEVSA